MNVRVIGLKYWPPGPRSAPLRDLDPLRLDLDDAPRERSCRFPVGDTPDTPEEAAGQLFCAEAADDDCPYCAAHRAKAWRGTPAAPVESLIEKKPQRRAA